MQKTGAPHTYDPSKLDAIVASIAEARGSLGQVADLNGIPRDTFYGWIRAGDTDNSNNVSSVLAQLSSKIREIQAKVVCAIAHEAFTDEKAARFRMWWLGKICREDFGDEGIEMKELRDIFKVLLPLMTKGLDHVEVNSSKTEQDS